MSFTVAVKEEILGQHHLSRYELSAIIKMSGSVGLSSSGLTLSVVTESAKLARHLYELLSDLYQVKSEIRHHQKTNLRKNRVYTVFLDQKVEEMLKSIKEKNDELEVLKFELENTRREFEEQKNSYEQKITQVENEKNRNRKTQKS